MKTRAELIKNILDYGLRIFSAEEFAKVAIELGYSKLSIGQLIFELKKEKIIESIKSGFYSLNSSFLTPPLTHYEIALAVVKEGFLSYLSAISIHGLTDQIPHITYISTKLNSGKYQGKNTSYNFDIRGMKYKVVKVRPERVFGIEEKLIGDIYVNITDLERTLIDAITRPAYCGGFREAIHYYEQSKKQIDINKIVEYAAKIGIFCLQRLGWIFDQIAYKEAAAKIREGANFKTFVKLDSSGARKGKYNQTWKVIENI